MTCYPSFADRLGDAVYTGARVEEDGNLVTGSGPGSALVFALALAARLAGDEVAAALREKMLVAA